MHTCVYFQLVYIIECSVAYLAWVTYYSVRMLRAHVTMQIPKNEKRFITVLTLAQLFANDVQFQMSIEFTLLLKFCTAQVANGFGVLCVGANCI